MGLADLDGAQIITLRSNRVESFRYELHRLVDGHWTVIDSNLQLVRECLITHDRVAEIKRTATFKVIENGVINFLTDAIRVFWRVRQATSGATTYEYKMGTFYLNSPTLPLLKQGPLREVTGYDALALAQQNKMDDWLVSPTGDNVSITVINILTKAFPNAGILLPLSPITFTEPRMSEAGASILDVVNRMLAYIGYTSLRANTDGSFLATPYVRPQDRSIDYGYGDDSSSLLIGDAQVFEQDVFDAPTGYVRTVSKPGTSNPAYPLISQYNIPSGPFSAAGRGRTIIDYASVDVADQATLDTLTKAEADQMMLRHTNLHFQTPLMPHDWAECLLFIYSRLPAGYNSLKWIERSWTFPCIPGGVMEHVAETALSAS